LQQDDDEQRRVESRVVLPLEPQRCAPGIHQQGAPGVTTEVGLWGVAPSTTSQARSPHRRAGASGEEGVDGGGRHRKLPPAEGDPSHGEGPADLQAHPRDLGFGLEDGGRAVSRTTAARRARYAVAEFPHDPEDLWRIKMRPEPGYISLVSFDSEFVMYLVRPLFSPLTLTWLYLQGLKCHPSRPSVP